MGYYVVYKLITYDFKKEFQSEIKTTIKESECTVIKLSKSSIDDYLVDDGKELFYEDNYYDIVKKKEEGNFILFYCLDDKKEDILFSLYCKHIKDHCSGNSHGKQPIKPAKKAAGALIKIVLPSINLLFSFSEKKETLSTIYKESIYEHPLKKILLPPKLS